jgi:hypothetical protein
VNVRAISKHRHCERSEAIHLLSFCGKVDCFAEPVIGRRLRADPLARNDGIKKIVLLPGCLKN